ncbi:hypothetical protein BJY52DRAFT_1224618 [Lactarius psammicola]|nr:hypothetical protein BJY52DRAFT_1224618 [Lactarius psammicola]
MTQFSSFGNLRAKYHLVDQEHHQTLGSTHPIFYTGSCSGRGSDGGAQVEKGGRACSWWWVDDDSRRDEPREGLPSAKIPSLSPGRRTDGRRFGRKLAPMINGTDGRWRSLALTSPLMSGIFKLKAQGTSDPIGLLVYARTALVWGAVCPGPRFCRFVHLPGNLALVITADLSVALATHLCSQRSPVPRSNGAQIYRHRGQAGVITGAYKVGIERDKQHTINSPPAPSSYLLQ